MQVKKDDIRRMVYGLAVGDAMGVPFEFKSREEIADWPLMELEGVATGNSRTVARQAMHWTHGLPPGTWSDDTSLTLALMESLAVSGGAIDYDAIMENFVSWSQEGAFTPHGHSFGIGSTTQSAITNFTKGRKKNRPALDCGLKGEQSNGNGSLMRIAPMAFWLCRHGDPNDLAKNLDYIHNVSSLTHAHTWSKMSCGVYVLILLHVLLGHSLEDAIGHGATVALDYYMEHRETYGEKGISRLNAILTPNFRELPVESLDTKGEVTGTLKAALWCLLNTNSYASCIRECIRLGYDTDTVAAAAGAVAGVYYGFSEESGAKGIPKKWTSGSSSDRRLQRTEILDEVIKRFSKSLKAS